MSDYAIYSFPKNVNISKLSADNIINYTPILKGKCPKNTVKYTISTNLAFGQLVLKQDYIAIALVNEGNGIISAYTINGTELGEELPNFSANQSNIEEATADNREKCSNIKKQLGEVCNDIFKMFIESKNYEGLLKVLARLYRYSFKNSLLIYSQNKEARYISNFNDWQKWGRMIKKNEKSISIFASTVYNTTKYVPRKNEEGEDTVDENGDIIVDTVVNENKYSNISKVFDISQTFASNTKRFFKRDVKLYKLYENKTNLLFAIVFLLNKRIIFSNNLKSTENITVFKIGTSFNDVFKNLLFQYVEKAIGHLLPTPENELYINCVEYIVFTELGLTGLIPEINFSFLPNNLFDFFEQVNNEARKILLNLYNYLNINEIKELSEYLNDKTYSDEKLKQIGYCFNINIDPDILALITSPNLSTDLCLLCLQVYNKGLSSVEINNIIKYTQGDLKIFRVISEGVISLKEKNLEILSYLFFFKNPNELDLINKAICSKATVEQLDFIFNQNISLPKKNILLSGIIDLNTNSDTFLTMEKMYSILENIDKDSEVLKAMLAAYQSNINKQVLTPLLNNLSTDSENSINVAVEDMVTLSEVQNRSENLNKKITTKSFDFLLARANKRAEKKNRARQRQ